MVNLIPDDEYGEQGTNSLNLQSWNIPNAIIGNAHIKDLAVDNAKIANATIESAKIVSLVADKVQTGNLQSTNWDTTHGSKFNLNDGTFYLGGSAAPALSWNGTTLTISGMSGYVAVGGAAADVNANVTTISGGKITTNTLDASAITTSTLSATLTLSGIFQTAASPNDRFTMDSTGIKAYKGASQRVQILNDGSGWFGSSADFSWTTAGVISFNGARLQSSSVVDAAISDMSVAKLTAGSITSKIITLALTEGAGDAAIKCGKTDFGNTTAGFILGLDDSAANVAKFEIGDATHYMNWTGSALDIYGGTLTVGNGYVSADTSGIWFNSNDVALIFKSGGVEKGAIYYSSLVPCLYLETSALNSHVEISSGGYLYLYAYSGISMSSSPFVDLPKQSATPASVEGRMYYDSDDHMAYIHNGSVWKTLF